jgi:hypothetical protein
MNQLFDFFFTNGPRRYRAYRISAFIAFVYAFANIWGLHRKEENVAPEMVGILLLSIVIFLLWHVFKGGVISDVPPPKFGRGFALVGTVSLLFLVSLRWIDFADMQAYLANAALHHYYLKFESVEAASIAPEAVQSNVRRIQSIVTASERYKVPVNPDTIQKTSSALSNYLKTSRVPQNVQQTGYSALLDLQSLNYSREAEMGTLATLPTSSVGRKISDRGNIIGSFLAFDQHDLLITGNHSLLVLAAPIQVSKVTIAFKGVDFQVRGVYPPLNVNQGGRIVIIDSIFQDGVQPLDNISWIDVQFRGTQPEYLGGPIHLRKVTFTNFDKDRLLFSLPPTLAQLIFDSDGKPIDYDLEPVK